MGFRPLGDRHAIQEVVFILTFARPLNALEIEKFASSHDLWKAELPKSLRPEVFQVFLGPTGPEGIPPPPPPTSISPVIFQSFRRDGTLEWQMQANQNWLAVNCLSYSRWDAISKQAISLLVKGLASFQTDELPILGMTLQYIDTFVWEGDLNTYSCSSLLNQNSKLLPSAFHPDGPVWHFHSGGYDLSGIAETGRRLMRRIHIDSLIEGPSSVTRMDISLTSDFLTKAGELQAITIDKIYAEMNWLHDENKKLLAEIISNDMQQRIALFGEQI